MSNDRFYRIQQQVIDLLSEEVDGWMNDLLKGVAIASIGPITSDTAQGLGFEVHITAETYTIPGLIDAILRYYARIEEQ